MYVRKFKNGIFHVTGHDHYVVLGLPKTKTILTIHDLVFLESYRGLKRTVLKWLFLDLPIQRCIYVTTVSEKSKSEILSLVACEPSKIRVIPNPVFELNSPILINKLNKVPILLFVGTTANKNLHNLIPALFKLPVRLRIVGRLNQQDLYLLSKFCLDYSNTFDLDDKEIQQEYLKADMLVFPSTYEGFGLPVIEAFQCGLPVITSDIEPMNMIAERAAIFVEPDSIASIRNGVVELLENPQLTLSLRLKGFELVKQYAAKQIANQYEQLYELVSSAN